MPITVDADGNPIDTTGIVDEYGFEPNSVAAKANQRLLSLPVPGEGKGAARRFIEGLGIPTDMKGWVKTLAMNTANAATAGSLYPALQLWDAGQELAAGHPMNAINTYNPVAPIMENIGEGNYAGAAGQIAGAAIPVGGGTAGQNIGRRMVKTGRMFTPEGELYGSAPKRAMEAWKVFSKDPSLLEHVTEGASIGVPGTPMRVSARTAMRKRRKTPVVYEQTMPQGEATPWEASQYGPWPASSWPPPPPAVLPGSRFAAAPAGPAIPVQGAMEAAPPHPGFNVFDPQQSLYAGAPRYLDGIQAAQEMNSSPTALAGMRARAERMGGPGHGDISGRPVNDVMADASNTVNAISAVEQTVGFPPGKLMQLMQMLKSLVPESEAPGTLPPQTHLESHRNSQLAAQEAKKMGFSKDIKKADRPPGTKPSGIFSSDKPLSGDELAAQIRKRTAEINKTEKHFDESKKYAPPELSLEELLRKSIESMKKGRK